ncbi:VirB2 family type IV secretion system major pilin TrwL [Bartonella fuyuanensis]|nr:VirB2 family type IV secretion system major pilin TrwL [Bartonella fuyuanensis]
MKKIINFQLKNNNKIITISANIIVYLMSSSMSAQAQMANTERALKALQEDLTKNIIPIAAAVILLCLAIGYAGRYIEKDTFIRWALGVIIAGSATQLTALLFTG